MKTLANSLFLILFLLPISAQAESRIAIIVNASNTQDISRKDVSNIYNDKVYTWANGEKIDIYNLPTVSKARDKFSRALLGLSARQASAAESNRRIANISHNPQMLKRERLLILSITKNKNAIGYVKASNIKHKKDIKILFFID